MSQDIVVFGSGQIAELADFYFRHDSDYRVVAFTVDGDHMDGDTFCGHPLVPFETVEKQFAPSECRFFVALSYSRLNALRAEKVEAAKTKGYELVSYVSSKATVFHGFEPGENAFILEDNTIQPFARIGRNVTLWSGNHIGHHSVIGDNCFLASHIVVSGGVTIGESCFIGVNATLRNGITIGERSVVGAGALVLNDAPAEAVFGPKATEIAKVPSSKLRSI